MHILILRYGYNYICNPHPMQNFKSIKYKTTNFCHFYRKLLFWNKSQTKLLNPSQQRINAMTNQNNFFFIVILNILKVKKKLTLPNFVLRECKFIYITFSHILIWRVSIDSIVKMKPFCN